MQNQRLNRPISVYPCHWSGCLQATCIPLSLVRIPAGYLHTPITGQDTCRVPAYPYHWSGYRIIYAYNYTYLRLTIWPGSWACGKVGRDGVLLHSGPGRLTVNALQDLDQLTTAYLQRTYSVPTAYLRNGSNSLQGILWEVHASFRFIYTELY